MQFDGQRSGTSDRAASDQLAKCNYRAEQYNCQVATSVVVATAVASIKLGIVGLIKRTTVAAGTHKFEHFATTKDPTK